MNKQIEEWINLIESETQIEPDSAFYELIQHKTDFFLDGVLQFSACELIIEVYSDEDFEDFEHNIYPELISGDARIINGDLESKDFETYIITNTPEYDDQELTNGLSRLVSGNPTDIANEIIKLKSYDWNNLLPIDKKDFTYFNSRFSHISFDQAFQDTGNTIKKIQCNLIGAEVYIFQEIEKLDTSIKQSIDFDNFVTLKYLIDEGCDKINLPFEAIPKNSIRGLNVYDFSEEETKIIESLSIENGLDSDSLNSYLILKDFKLPDSESFLKENKKNILLIQGYLGLAFKHSYIFFEALYYKLMSYETCIWNVYPILKNLNFKNHFSKKEHEKVKNYNQDRFIVEFFSNQNDFEDSESKFNFSFKEDFINEVKYLNFEKDLGKLLEKEYDLDDNIYNEEFSADDLEEDSKINTNNDSEELKSNDFTFFKQTIKKARLYVEKLPRLIDINAPMNIIEDQESKIYSSMNELNKIKGKFKSEIVIKQVHEEMAQLYYEIGDYKMKFYEKDKSRKSYYDISIKCFEHSASLQNKDALKALKKYLKP